VVVELVVELVVGFVDVEVEATEDTLDECVVLHHPANAAAPTRTSAVLPAMILRRLRRCWRRREVREVRGSGA